MDPTLIIGAIGTAVAGIITALSLLVRARARAGAPLHVLQRWWDWWHLPGDKSDLPEPLRIDTERVLGEAFDEGATT